MKRLRALIQKVKDKTEDTRVCRAVFLLIVAGQMLLAFFWMTERTGYHLDELYSFGHAQAYFSPDPSDKEYIHNSSVWKYETWTENREMKERLEVSEEESAFSRPLPKVVKKLLKGRNYYGILNILLSAFTRGKISPYPGTVFNMVFLFFTQILLYRITGEITGNAKIALLAVLMYGFSTMALNMTLYIRFYTFSIFLIMAATRLHQIMWRTGNLWQCEALIAAAMALFYFAIRNSALTLVFVGALVFCYMLGLLGKKQYRKAACYLVTVVPAGLAYLLRKTYYLDILLNPADYTEDFWPLRDMVSSVLTINGKTFLLVLRTFLKWFAETLFGSKYCLFGFSGMLLLLLCARVLRGKKAGKPLPPEQREKFGFVLVIFGTVGIYLLFAGLTFASLISLATQRYLSFIYPAISILLWSALFFLTERGPFRNTVISVCAIMTLSGIVPQQILHPNPEYVYLGDKPVIRAIQDTGIRDSIIVYDGVFAGELPVYDCVSLMPESSRVYPVSGEHNRIDTDHSPDELLIWTMWDTDIAPYVEDLTSGGYQIMILGRTHASDVYTARRIPAQSS